jgi:hypothetical protein
LASNCRRRLTLVVDVSSRLVPQEVIDLSRSLCSAGSVGGVRADALARALHGRLNATLCAWRMYATRSAAPATRATARNEKSRAEACYTDAGPRWCASTRLAM